MPVQPLTPHHAQVFSGATTSMQWLSSAAKRISKEGGAPVEWTTPLGLPVIQPYLSEKLPNPSTFPPSMLLLLLLLSSLSTFPI